MPIWLSASTSALRATLFWPCATLFWHWSCATLFWHMCHPVQSTCTILNTRGATDSGWQHVPVLTMLLRPRWAAQTTRADMDRVGHANMQNIQSMLAQQAQNMHHLPQPMLDFKGLGQTRGLQQRPHIPLGPSAHAAMLEHYRVDHALDPIMAQHAQGYTGSIPRVASSCAAPTVAEHFLIGSETTMGPTCRMDVCPTDRFLTPLSFVCPWAEETSLLTAARAACGYADLTSGPALCAAPAMHPRLLNAQSNTSEEAKR